MAKLKSSNTSNVGSQQLPFVGSQQAAPYGICARITYTDANGVEQEVVSDVFASSELAEAAKIGMEAVLKASGAQNIRARIINAN